LEALHGFYGVMKRRDGKQGSLFWFAIPYKPDTSFACHSLTAVEERLLILNSKESSGVAHPSTQAISTSCDVTEAPTVAGPIPISNPADLEDWKSSDSLQILLVDDSPTIVKMSSLMLTKLGYEVTPAENGAVAVKIVENKLKQATVAVKKDPLFDVILMDLQMPIMDGLEATQRIRQLEQEYIASLSAPVTAESSLPWRRQRHVIIGMSANSDHETSVNAFAAGMDAFLPKPFKVDAFRAAFDQVTSEA
jgi:CheY-like chemotaxis protein